MEPQINTGPRFPHFELIEHGTVVVRGAFRADYSILQPSNKSTTLVLESSVEERTKWDNFGGLLSESNAKLTLKTADSCGREFPLSCGAVWPSAHLTPASPSPLFTLLISVASHGLHSLISKPLARTVCPVFFSFFFYEQYHLISLNRGPFTSL